jgi:hypothetical protein
MEDNVEKACYICTYPSALGSPPEAERFALLPPPPVSGAFLFVRGYKNLAILPISYLSINAGI